ncbi:MAG: hypothetical protein ACTS3F_07645 [Phycisphaerales bacterium]
MDDQQNQNKGPREQGGQGLTVGAGLQESRLNTDLIDFLRKYGPYALYATLIVVGLYVAVNWYQERGEATRDQAFVALTAAAQSGSPDALLEVAEAHRGEGSVSELARLRAAMLIVESARLGVAVGTPQEQRANPPAEARLDEAQVNEHFSRAESLYRSVLERTRNQRDRYLVAQQARWGLATALSGQGKFDEAISVIEEYKATGERAGWSGHVAIAEERLVLLQDAKALSALPTLASIPASNRAPATTPGVQAPVNVRQNQQLQPGMPIPNPMRSSVEEQDGMSVNRLTDPEMIRRLEEQLRQAQQGGGGSPAVPTPTPEPAPQSEPDPAPAPEPDQPADPDDSGAR